jgi:phosphatidylglycerophosphatase A
MSYLCRKAYLIAMYSIPNYNMFWLFYVHCFNCVSRKCISKCKEKAMYLEKPKCLIIWDEVFGFVSVCIVMCSFVS